MELANFDGFQKIYLLMSVVWYQHFQKKSTSVFLCCRLDWHFSIAIFTSVIVIWIWLTCYKEFVVYLILMVIFGFHIVIWHVLVVRLSYLKYDFIFLLQTMLEDPSLFLDVPQLSAQDVHGILETWLNLENRTLTEQQMKVVETAFDHCPLPLFLKVRLIMVKHLLNCYQLNSQSESDLCVISCTYVENQFKVLPATFVL